MVDAAESVAMSSGSLWPPVDRGVQANKFCYPAADVLLYMQ